MDNKKTNLTPELKEIYDRVMNTTTPPKAAPTPPPTQPTIPSSTPPSPVDALTPQNTPPIATAPVMPSTPAYPNASTGGQDLPTSLNVTTPAEDALSSTPARPVSEINDKAFSFSGTAPAPPPVPHTDNPPQKKGSRLSLPVLIVIGIAFLVIWGVFWAIIFGFIKR